MNSVFSSTHSEGLKIARLLMVISSISPLFFLWAIRGSSFVCDRFFVTSCMLIAIIPSIFLYLRFCIAKKNNDKREIIVGRADDHRDHLLVYLFTMLLPFYSQNINNLRELIATLSALAFIVFLFWHLNLHYMNLLFAVCGYRVFTICPPISENPLTGKTCRALITRRVSLKPEERIVGYRLSETVYWEVDS